MRLHLAAITAALVLVPAAAPAWADTTPPAITATQPAAEAGPVILSVTMEPIGTRARIFVHAVSAVGITKVSASLRLKGSDETYALDGDVKRFYGTEQDGNWNPTPFELKEGRTYLDLELTDATGARKTVRAATFTDLPASRFSVEASVLGGNLNPYPTSKAFGLSATVRHLRPVGRVTAQLHKWQSDETVGDEIPLSVRSTSQGVTVYEAKDVFKPPVGDYDIVVTATDDQGDSVQARTGRVIEGIASRIDELKATPDWYDADHRDVTITGRLVSADGSPLEGTTVTVSGTENQTTTAADGTFTLKLTAQSVTVRIVSSRRGFQLATKATVALEHHSIPSRLSLKSSAGAAKIGDSVTLSGTLERQTTPGAYAPLAGRTVTILYYDRDTRVTSWDYATATTDANGRYSVKVTVPGSGQWTARANLSGGDFATAEADIDIDASYRTSVVDFQTTTPRVAARGKATLTGRVVRSHASPALTPVGVGDVSVFFAADGKNWTYQGSLRTTADGRFTATKTAARDGYWQVRYDGGYSYLPVPPWGVRYAFDEPSTSGRVFVDTAIATRISSFNASPEPVRKGRTLTVKGRVTKQVGTWKAGAGATLTVYFKPSGSSKWKAMGTAKADRNGWFTKNFKASADGTWAAAYAGSSTYLGVWSAGDYVDVR
ncbi:carboxypeptidase regulatory-like domain-containing protein [Actinomadura oligospora]|uniref:carboxypeptidase regulatory-like domain-containing protein n=1 Tax=Actinomadura oligospora TaxID=111804 RepID=UPI00047D67C2|nr:carboxypeptidase regulatory-like domain-containing protein [Actinomadura oligospora]